MPSTYTHYKFGKDVFNKLPKARQKEIQSQMSLYKIGLHGPDILFYYKALTTNHVNQTGFGMHDKPAKDFFEPAKKVIKESHQPAPNFAYVYGFICHFVLDSQCHGYIEEKIQASGVSHTEIEVEFDRYLMIRDKHNPIKHHLTRHITPSEENAKVIAPYFEGITPKEVEKSLKAMKRYNDFLVAPGKLKRKVIYTLLKMTGNFEEMKGLIVNYVPNPKCKDSCEKLDALYSKAIDVAVTLIKEYGEFVYENKPLNKRYEKTFGVE